MATTTSAAQHECNSCNAALQAARSLIQSLCAGQQALDTAEQILNALQNTANAAPSTHDPLVKTTEASAVVDQHTATTAPSESAHDPLVNTTEASALSGTRSDDPLSPALVNDVDSPLTQHVPPEQRWYAVYVGRQPGVYQGFQHVSNNTQGIPGNAQQRCVSEASAWSAFTDALDANRVVRVTMHLQEERLTRADFNL
ncbi:hypothetical protein H0H92_014635 [Tricholoma furcatifolium]|nr:hypothetical protein H0H92_014635 [Tricholoma furcatifolium]